MAPDKDGSGIPDNYENYADRLWDQATEIADRLLEGLGGSDRAPDGDSWSDSDDGSYDPRYTGRDNRTQQTDLTPEQRDQAVDYWRQQVAAGNAQGLIDAVAAGDPGALAAIKDSGVMMLVQDHFQTEARLYQVLSNASRVAYETSMAIARQIRA